MPLYLVYHQDNPDYKWITNDFDAWLKENNLLRFREQGIGETDSKLDEDEWDIVDILAFEDEDEYIVEEISPKQVKKIDKIMFKPKQVKEIEKKYKKVINNLEMGGDEINEICKDLPHQTIY